MKRPSTLTVLHASSLWFPIMLAEASKEISEAKAAELLSMNIIDYREQKNNVVQAVVEFLDRLPSPLISLVAAIAARPELFDPVQSSSNSNTAET